MPTSGHYYVIINKKSGTAFDLSGQDQKSIIGFTVHRGDNQKVRCAATPRSLSDIVDLISISPQWKFTQFDDGWTIQNKYNGKYLDIEVPNSPGNGVSVVAIDTQNPRKWYVIYDDQFGGWR